MLFRSMRDHKCTHKDTNKVLGTCFRCFHNLETVFGPCSHIHSSNLRKLDPSGYSFVLMDNYKKKLGKLPGQKKKNLRKSRKLYKQGKYFQRPKVKTFKSRKSNHLNHVRKIYGVEKIGATKELASKTQCNIEGLEEILSKGRGAYYSSGSRPNQTADSWAVARLASALTGGNASAYDFHVLKEHCAP